MIACYVYIKISNKNKYLTQMRAQLNLCVGTDSGESQAEVSRHRRTQVLAHIPKC